MWKERIFDKEKISEKSVEKAKLVFCLFGPLISWCFNGLNDKKNMFGAHYLINLYIFKYKIEIYSYIDIYIYIYIYIYMKILLHFCYFER